MKPIPDLRPDRMTPATTGALFTVLMLLAGCGAGDGSSVPPAAAVVTVVRTAALAGAQEVPPVTTSATARGAVVVDPVTREITGGLTFSGLTPSAAHIHDGAPGVNGPIAIGLILGTGTATVPPGAILTEAQYQSLLAGNLYLNIHTAANPAGELRGQITGQGGAVAGLATLTGAQEVPPVTTAATGKGTVVIDSATREIITAIVTTSGVSASAAHIHEGATGVSGPISVGLTLGPNSATAPVGATLTNTQCASLLAGNLYFNVHSAGYPAGEIRGQINIQLDANGQPIGGGSCGGGGGTTLMPTLASIQANVFTPSCAFAGCHGGASAQQGLRLDPGFSADTLIGIASPSSASLVRVVPGNPNNSFLIQKLEGTQTLGGRMPLGGPFLSQADINVIRQWIANGALR